MKNLEYYFRKAKIEGWAMGQFNFSVLEQMKGILAAAAELKSPVILGTSEGESKFFGLEEAVALRDALKKKTGLPIFLNLDHGKSLEHAKKAIDAGYDMVHFDGSELPLQENIKATKEVVKYAKWRQVLVEGEVGRIEFEIRDENLTKPEEAKEYTSKTGVKLLAVSIGNFHGTTFEKESPNLRMDLLKKIKSVVGDRVCLVLHGGSGTPENDIKEAISQGIVKININTELRLAFTESLKKVLNENPQEITPYKYLPRVVEAVHKVAEEKIKLFGTAGRI